MDDFKKSIYSLFFALVVLIGILFLPTQIYEQIKEVLDYLEGSTNTASAFGVWLFQKFSVAAILIFVTLVLTVAAKKAYQEKYGDVKED